MRRKAISVILSLVMVLGLMPQAALPSLAAPGDVIAFPDANFEVAVREVIGKPAGAITKGDVENITELDVSSREIADLTGIEHFVALEELNCAFNRLMILDVSKNTALETLRCAGNELTALDVSNNNALLDLDLWVNQLTALDVSNNTALERLNCGVNQLTALDVSKNTALTTLDCFSNQVTTLDVSKNTALTWLDFRNCQLTTLDVSNNTALIFLGCSNNQLTALDVSNNNELSVLLCNNNYLPSKSAIVGFDESKPIYIAFHPQNLPPPNLDTASDWGRDHIDQAYAKDFLPEELLDNYQSPITRGEFVRLAMSWLRYKTGKYGDNLLEERGLTRGAFSDTDDPVILAAAALGITAGVGYGKFGVNDQFNREQAAVMLVNVRGILGEDTDFAPEFGFADIDEASNWAHGSINFVGGADIMAGVGENRFDPKGTFSREQSIIVFNKMG